MVIATSGDPIIQVHRAVGEGARSAVRGLPTVSSAGMRTGHAEMLEGALGEARKVLTELARVADVGTSGAEGLSGRDHESAGKFEGWHGETRVV